MTARMCCALQWRRMVPNEPGWWWLQPDPSRLGGGVGPIIRFVDYESNNSLVGDGGKDLLIMSYVNDKYVRAEDFEGFAAGPIPMPGSILSGEI